ncbi:hypothetical protein Tco_1553907, partial [Tanacetum coccineum]
MDDDLFTYEVEVAKILCDSKMDDDSEHEADDDMGYDPSDVAFTETESLYPNTFWELLPKKILGVTTQRDTRSYYPKRYWKLLPKEILGAITQRETGMSFGKME